MYGSGLSLKHVRRRFLPACHPETRLTAWSHRDWPSGVARVSRLQRARPMDGNLRGVVEAQRGEREGAGRGVKARRAVKERPGSVWQVTMMSTVQRHGSKSRRNERGGARQSRR